MIRLVALRPIPGPISIPAGATFIELDDDRAAEYVATGHAQFIAPPEPRGWNGLDWEGATVVILASGPSLTVEQCEAVRHWQEGTIAGRYVIAINTTFRRAPFADMVYACDGEWWRAMENGLRYIDEVTATFDKSRLWTQDRKAADDFGLRYIESARLPGLSRDPRRIHQGNNSGYQCINIAYHAGARRIILLGFDCKPGHWHKPHPSPLSNSAPVERWKREFRALAADLAQTSVEVVNCTPGTALKAFKTELLADALAR